MADTSLKRPVAGPGHFVRPRLNELLDKASQNPLVILCAGTGYGKSRAVSDFIHGREASVGWVALTEQDNTGPRFWEKFARTVAQLDGALGGKLLELGFPDTTEKLNQYVKIRKQFPPGREVILVFDDLHLLTEPAINRFLERSLHTTPRNGIVFLLCRDIPRINLTGIQMKGLVSMITEEHLCFTQSELSQYFAHQDLPSVRPRSLSKIHHDTKGWAFAVNLIALSLKNSPGYEGYVQPAMRQNIFDMMEAEVWNVVSEPLRRLLVRLSLTDHLAADLVASLAGGSHALLAELKRQNAYIRFDSYTNAYLFHPLLLDFLRTKQDLLTEEERNDTFGKSAFWCNQNGFTNDALRYYENVRDYAAILSILNEFPMQIPTDIARASLAILERAPKDIYYKEAFFAARHMQVLMSLGYWEKAMQAAKSYEQDFLRFSGDDTLKNHALGSIYYVWGILRMQMGISDDSYDFDTYYAKMDGYLRLSPINADQIAGFLIGPWISMVGAARKGAQQEFAAALTRSVGHLTSCLRGRAAGMDELCKGELKFYQGDIPAAELLIDYAWEQAREYGQRDVTHRALLYTMRIAASRGDRARAEQALREMEDSLSAEEHASRFITYDIALGWYYYLLREPGMVPGWLKKRFAPYDNTAFIENFGNQMKARYCYLTKNHPPLLTYIEELKHRESILFGRIEMLAMEACIYFQRKEKRAAFDTLKQAYEAASPNGVVMPFIELGKDIRTLTASALRELSPGIPRLWLDEINRKASTYAKHQSLLISDYKNITGAGGKAVLSPREKKVLKDLYNGLSRSEIATNQSLSINTINSIVNNIYEKLNANNIVDVVRIVVERNLL
ncbi:MAG TPA: hypothetical protein DEB31_11555 [Clostridiales bacterium]|nr:hypothetical protein [Clostridiales bacterium]